MPLDGTLITGKRALDDSTGAEGDPEVTSVKNPIIMISEKAPMMTTEVGQTPPAPMPAA